MKTKKLVSSILLILLLMSELSLLPFNNFVYAANESETDTSNRFHYNQLVENAKDSKDNVSKVAVRFYDAIYDMYINEELKTGTASRDLSVNNIITQDELKNYVKGDKTLSDGMNAARYAFYADYPEVFYVNFSRLSLRVTQSINGYHVNIGSGRYENYYTEGFETKEEVDNAIQVFENRVNEIKDGAEQKDTIKEKIKYVHDEIINKVSYRYENECYNGNQGFLGTPYGVLIKRQGVCEGYARAFKVVMDRLGITCILVQGLHKYSGEVAVEHMWNYVRIDEVTSRTSSGKWYAVDCTQDDPATVIAEAEEYATYTKFKENLAGGENYGLDGFENEEYLLVGEIAIRERHFENPIIEAAGEYEFEYPILEEENFGSYVSENTDGFKIATRDREETDNGETVTSLEVTFSYRGMSVQTANKQGIYVLARWLDSEEDTDAKWVYMVPGGMAFGNSEDGKTSTFITGPSKYLEFAITDKKYPENGNIDSLIYKGNDNALIARSERIYNKNYTYKPAPYIVRQSPPQTTTIPIRTKPYKVTATWGSKVVVEEGKTPTARITCKSILGSGVTGDKYATAKNVVFDEETNTVTFDFALSQMYADDTVSYNIYIDGLVGETSGKAPNPIYLGASNDIECPSKQAAKGAWNVYGKPTLIENKDLSIEDWTTSNGTKIEEMLRHRVALVTTQTTKTQKEQMEEKLDEKFPNDEIVKSETYNITLTVCKAVVIGTGHKVTMKIGFPEGYGPESEGVTFKAYHFSRDSEGNVISVEEIDCVVTQYGLIITCDAFSPFEVAVVKDDGTNKSTKKSLIATAEDCGKVSVTASKPGSVAGSVVTLDKGENAIINVVPDEGYQVETLTVCGELVDLSKTRSTTGDTKQITVDYDQIKDGNAIVNATFVAKQVASDETAKNQTVAAMTPEIPTIEMPSETLAGLNSSLIIETKVSETIGIKTYQWYKDGIKLEGKTNSTLNIKNIGSEHTGTYTLKVTTTTGTVSEVTEKSCEVSIASISASMKKSTEQKLKPGDKIEIITSITELNNVNDGLVNFSGKLIYDNDSLELTKMEGLNGWNLEEAYNPESKIFVIDNNRKVNAPEDILKMTFTVKDSDKLTSNLEVRIEEVFASDAKMDIGGADIKTTILVDVPDRVPTITSSEYKVEKGFITRIIPKTTIAEFKKNVKANTNLTFIKDGKTLNDSSIITTNTILKLGNLEYVLSVTGDVDGNYNETLQELITLTDLAQLKLYYIESKQITLSEASKKAADINEDGQITLTDLAQLKLVLIGLMEIK